MGKTLLLYKVKNLGRTPVPVNKSRNPRLRQLEGKRWMIRGKTYKKNVIMLLSIWEEDSLLRPATLSCSQQHSLSHSSHLNLPHYKNLPKSPFDICWIFSPCIFGFLIFTPFTEQWLFAISLSIFSFCILIFLHCKWQFEYLGKRWRGRMQRTSGVFLSVHLVPTLGRSSIQHDISKSKSCFMHVNRWENGRWDTGISVGTTAVCLFAYVCVCTQDPCSLAGTRTGRGGLAYLVLVTFSSVVVGVSWLSCRCTAHMV